jgi:hypothetical protein
MILTNVDLSRFEPNIVDPITGYSLSVPAIYQAPPFWWEDQPAAYRRILTLRREMGMTVDDWDGQDRPKRGPRMPLEARGRSKVAQDMIDQYNAAQKGTQR